MTLPRKRFARVLLICRKDMIALGRMYWVFAATYLILIVTAGVVLKTSLILEIMPALFVMGLFASEAYRPTDTLIASFPVSRTEIVLARYLLALLTVALIVALMMASAWVQHAVRPERYADWNYINDIWSVILLYLLNSLVIIVAFPFRFALGLPAGVAVGYLLIFAHLPLMILSESLLERLNADLGRMLRMADLNTSLFGYNAFLFGRTADAWGAKFYLPAAAIFVGALAFSAWISVYGYRRRALQ